MRLYCQYLLWFCALLWSSSSQAQQDSRLTIDLYRLMQETPSNAYADMQVPVLIKGELIDLEQWVAKAGGQYRYGLKDIASVQLSLAQIEVLLAEPFVERIEYRVVQHHHLSHPDDTIMLSNNQVRPVHQGVGNLPQAYKGRGVLLGVIDDGFELEHPDFLHADQKTRVLHLWDQGSNNSNYAEQYYGYGASWDSFAINRQQCTQLPLGHGTHVMGTAGGNAQAANKYLGIAPEADLACVKLGTVNFLTSFVDATHYLFSRASDLGMPCVINSSVGSYQSGHDGRDLSAQLIDQMLEAAPGRALVQAGGNARASAFHLGARLQQDSIYTRFAWHAAQQRTHWICYADTADFKQMEFSLQLIEPSSDQVLLQTPSYQLERDFNFQGSIAQLSQVLFTAGAGDSIRLQIYIDQYEGTYEVAFSLASNQNLGHWQFTTTGTGKYDCWSSEQLTGTSNIIKKAPSPHYLNPDSIQSIVGFWTCSDKVITVASYQNRDTMVTWQNDTINIGTAAFPELGISHFSSLGPTRTGLQKPDLTAPGGQVLSAAPLGTLNYYKNIGDQRLDKAGWHVSNRGTSMAAPMVAGAIALYLQCQPYADYNGIKQALQRSARLDPWVFAEVVAWPNIHWGYGKLDVTALVEECLVYGCTDTLALNYNALATVNDSSCFYLVSGVEEAVAIPLELMPNPAQEAVWLTYPADSEAKILVGNSLGQCIWEGVATDTGQLLNLVGWSAGWYTITYQSAKSVVTKRLVKLSSTN